MNLGDYEPGGEQVVLGCLGGKWSRMSTGKKTILWGIMYECMKLLLHRSFGQLNFGSLFIIIILFILISGTVGSEVKRKDCRKRRDCRKGAE